MTSTYRTSDDRDLIRARVAELAAAQAGVSRREHLEAWGVDPGIVRTMTGRGLWTKLRHGVYADSATVVAAHRDVVQRHLLDAAAAIHALALPAYAFAATGAVAHGLPVQRGLLGDVQLIRPLSTDVRALHRRIKRPEALPGARVRTHQVANDAITTVGGLPCVSAPLAAISTAAVSSPEWAVATLDAVAWEQPDMPAQLNALAAGWPFLRGIGVVRAALPHVRTGAQTPLESLSRLRLVDCGLSEPMLQVPFHDQRGLVGCVDMWWPDLRVIGEADGLLKYDSRDRLVEEKVREDRLRALGLGVVRWTWAEIHADPAAVAARITAASRTALRRVG
jgi:hypothetical protein